MLLMKILALVGSYRKGGTIDAAIDEILEAAREAGAETEKIYLVDEPIEFCRNCRVCTQENGSEPGECVVDDAMGGLIERIEAADGIVLGSPMNIGTVTAVTKRFMERVVCYAHWPWGQAAPRLRKREPRKRAVLVASSAAPSLMARLTTGMVKIMKDVARMLGARTVGVLFIGLAAMEEHRALPRRARGKARALGRKLATNRSDGRKEA